MHRVPSWGLYVALVVLFEGVWGAFAAAPTALYGYPEGLIYAVWSVTMIVPAGVVLLRGRLDRRRSATARGLAAGLLGASGQLVLFSALAVGPAYLVFPVVSMAPAVTVALALVLLKERLRAVGLLGLVGVLVAIVILSASGGTGSSTGPWLPLALVVTAAWGTQGYLIRRSAMDGVNVATSFTWMAVAALLLTPIALLSTGGAGLGTTWAAPALTFGVQLLNAFSALFLVMALARGRASVVSPVAGALAPALTVVVSLIVTRTVPSAAGTAGVLLALGGSALMAWSDATRGSRVAPTGEGATGDA